MCWDWLVYVLYTNKLEKYSSDFSTDFVKKTNFGKKSWITVSMDFRKFRKFLGTEYFQLHDWEKSFLRRKRNLQHGFSVVQLISIPSMGLYNISAPIISKHFADDTIKELVMFTIKTSLSLFFLGLVLFSVSQLVILTSRFYAKIWKIITGSATVGLGELVLHCCLNWRQVLTVTLFPCQNIIDLIFTWCCFWRFLPRVSTFISSIKPV